MFYNGRLSAKPKQDPSHISVSYTFFFIVLTFIWAEWFSAYFPVSVREEAFIICIAYPLILYVFRFCLMQFYDGVTVLQMIVLFFVFSAALDFCAVARGPVAGGQLPVIETMFFNVFVYFRVVPALLIPTVFTFYGWATLMCAMISGWLVEAVYIWLASFFATMPQTAYQASRLPN